MIRYRPDRMFLRVLMWIALIVISTLGIVLAKTTFWEGFQVPSPSMTPTLRVGDLVWVDKKAFGYRWPWSSSFESRLPDYADVIVFIHPQTKEFYVKRVIGRPGDTVMVLGRRVYVNGELFETMEQPADAMTQAIKDYNWDIVGRAHWMRHKKRRYRVLFTHKEFMSWHMSGYWIVPDKHVFVMGDLRDESSDSREWGMVAQNDIVGKVRCIIDAGLGDRESIPDRSNCSIDAPRSFEEPLP